VAELIDAVAKRHGLDGQDGRDKDMLHSATSKVFISSMMSIYSEWAADAALVLLGVACSQLGARGCGALPSAPDSSLRLSQAFAALR